MVFPVSRGNSRKLKTPFLPITYSRFLPRCEFLKESRGFCKIRWPQVVPNFASDISWILVVVLVLFLFQMMAALLNAAFSKISFTSWRRVVVPLFFSFVFSGKEGGEPFVWYWDWTQNFLGDIVYGPTAILESDSHPSGPTLRSLQNIADQGVASTAASKWVVLVLFGMSGVICLFFLNCLLCFVCNLLTSEVYFGLTFQIPFCFFWRFFQFFLKASSGVA